MCEEDIKNSTEEQERARLAAIEPNDWNEWWRALQDLSDIHIEIVSDVKNDDEWQECFDLEFTVGEAFYEEYPGHEPS